MMRDMNVNCDQVRPKLQDLIEGMLTERAAAAIRSHLDSCAGCRRQRALLALIAEGLARMPAQRPSAAFDVRVLAAAAAARRLRAPSRRAVWMMNAAASATVLWTAVLAAFVRPRLGVLDMLAAAELRLVEAGLSVPEALRAARHAAAVVARIHVIPGSALAALPLQCAVAALIAGFVVAATVWPRPNFDVSRRI